jgi:hypothetical protein
VFVSKLILKFKEQMEISMLYKLTLEQRWEKIFLKENEKLCRR